jgi:elongator complex protein 1
MSKLRRQYTIDDHLGRYSKALKHLYELDAFDELKAYTVKHELYKEALNLHRYQPVRLQETMRLYAKYLNNESRYKEAGLGISQAPCFSILKSI